MGNRYGQNLKYGVLGAPTIFSGDPLSFSYRDQTTKENLDGASGDYVAMGLHSRQGEINFECEVTSDTTDFLDLQAGGKISVATSLAGVNLGEGTIIAHEAVEKWTLMRRKTCSVRATHFPDCVGGDGASAGTLSAFTPSQTLDFLFPGNTLTYSTLGLGHTSGIVHELSVRQTLQVTPDEPSPDGKILGVFTSGYERVISLLLLASPGMASIPAPRSVLAISGAPAHLSGYRVVSAEPRLERKKGMMFSIEAAWIPAMA